MNDDKTEELFGEQLTFKTLFCGLLLGIFVWIVIIAGLVSLIKIIYFLLK